MPGTRSLSAGRSLTLLLATIALALSTLAAGAAAASEPEAFSFQKDCAGANLFCTIHDATAPFTFLNGMTVWYVGPGQVGKTVRDGRTFISYGVTIGPSAAAGVATGHFRWQGTHGSWTLHGSGGQLAGFHAEGEMSFVDCVGDTCTFALTGWYHVTP
jgi:hypothetical protein